MGKDNLFVVANLLLAASNDSALTLLITSLDESFFE